MLTSMNDIPANSQSPLSPDYFQGDGGLYSVYAQAITAKAASQCIPGPQAFAALSPAGSIIPQVQPNAAQPALGRAVSAPSPVSPLAAQVAHVQARLRQGLVNSSNSLTAAIDQISGQGAVNSPDDFADAAEVVPMGSTPNVIAERRNPSSGANVIARRSQAPAFTPRIPAPQWGAAPVLATPGTCTADGSLSGWAKIFLAAGIGIAVLAAFDRR